MPFLTETESGSDFLKRPNPSKIVRISPDPDDHGAIPVLSDEHIVPELHVELDNPRDHSGQADQQRQDVRQVETCNHGYS